MRGLLGRDAGSKPVVCLACGHQGPPRASTPGSFAIEVVLWLCFILPGLVYSMWRLSRRTAVCSACGATTLVPPGSPVARKFLADLAKPPA